MVRAVSSRKIKGSPLEGRLKGRRVSSPKIAIVVSLFNEDICRQLLKGCIQTLRENNYSEGGYSVFEVAGAFEIPLMAQKVLQTKKYLGAVTLGCVIRGDTPHFEYISQAVTMGCLQVQLNTGYPLAFGVITVNNTTQALERSGDDEFNKGREAALALLDSLETIRKI